MNEQKKKEEQSKEKDAIESLTRRFWGTKAIFTFIFTSILAMSYFLFLFKGFREVPMAIGLTVLSIVIEWAVLIFLSAIDLLNDINKSKKEILSDEELKKIRKGNKLLKEFERRILKDEVMKEYLVSECYGITFQLDKSLIPTDEEMKEIKKRIKKQKEFEKTARDAEALTTPTTIDLVVAEPLDAYRSLYSPEIVIGSERIGPKELDKQTKTRLQELEKAMQNATGEEKELLLSEIVLLKAKLMDLGYRVPLTRLEPELKSYYHYPGDYPGGCSCWDVDFNDTFNDEQNSEEGDP